MNKEFDNILRERFSTDSLISVATVDNCGVPWVRTVDAIYIDGAFYTITHNSTKVKQIESYAENLFGKTINCIFLCQLVIYIHANIPVSTVLK